MTQVSTTEVTTVSTVLASSPASSRLAREFAVTALGGRGRDAVGIIVSELVTNAVLHGGCGPHLCLRITDTEVTIEVSDDAAGVPVVRDAPTTDTCGRGMAIVAHFAEAWGVRELPVGAGKQVWARVRLGA